MAEFLASWPASIWAASAWLSVLDRKTRRTRRPRIAYGLALAFLPLLGLLMLAAIWSPDGPVRLSLSAAEAGPRLAADQPAVELASGSSRWSNAIHLGFGVLEGAVHHARRRLVPVGRAQAGYEPDRRIDARDRRVPVSGDALDQPQDRRGAGRAGPVRLRLSVLEARAGPADDDAGAEGGDQAAARRSADRRPPQANPAADGAAPPEFDRFPRPT